MSAGSTRSKWSSETGPETLFGGKDASLFGRRQKRPRGARLPVVAVTGFLGSGKTTLIRALLDKPEGAGTAVVVNEYGEIGIDHALLRSSSDATVLLGNGCLCCNVRSDLQETLRELFADRARGAVPSFRARRTAPESQVRSRLPAGGKWIRTLGPSREDVACFAEEESAFRSIRVVDAGHQFYTGDRLESTCKRSWHLARRNFNRGNRRPSIFPVRRAIPWSQGPT
jgi:CobW/HypB/UreG, nucleotide-binding domain